MAAASAEQPTGASSSASPAAAAEALARAWIAAWNQRDLQHILEHYSDDVVFSSPRVAARSAATGARVGDASGRLVGKQALRDYFAEAIEALGESLHLELQGVLLGVDNSVAVSYRRETGARVVEVFRLERGSSKAAAVEVFYDSVC